MPKHRFQFSLKNFLLAAFAIGLFILLGVWQLNRAQEKELMLSSSKHFSSVAAVEISAKSPPLQYQQVKISGQFLPQVLLLDNQYYNHQVGYEVLSALQLDSGEVVLIDRGWVSSNIQRRELPNIFTPKKIMSLIGHVYYPSKKVWVLGQVIEAKSPNLAVIEKIDAKPISQFLHKSVYPFIIRLNKNERYGYIRDWKITSLSPLKHKGYAFQWFAIATAIFIIYLGLSLKKVNENEKA